MLEQRVRLAWVLRIAREDLTGEHGEGLFALDLAGVDVADGEHEEFAVRVNLGACLSGGCNGRIGEDDHGQIAAFAAGAERCTACQRRGRGEGIEQSHDIGVEGGGLEL